MKCRLYLVDVGLDVVIAEHDVMNSEQGVQLTGLLPIEHILVHLYSVQQLLIIIDENTFKGIVSRDCLDPPIILMPNGQELAFLVPYNRCMFNLSSDLRYPVRRYQVHESNLETGDISR